jgi:hypothetical protein
MKERKPDAKKSGGRNGPEGERIKSNVRTWCLGLARCKQVRNDGHTNRLRVEGLIQDSMSKLYSTDVTELC